MTWLLIPLIFVLVVVIGVVALKVLSSSPEFDDRYASNPMDRSTDEQVFFDEKGVTVTSSRLVAGTHDYSLCRVRKAAIKTITINWVIGIVARTTSIVGIVFAVVGLFMIFKDIQAPIGAAPLLMGSGLFVVGRILLLSVYKRHRVVLQTESAEVEAVEDSDFFFIQKVVQAINRAIESH